MTAIKMIPVDQIKVHILTLSDKAEILTYVGQQINIRREILDTMVGTLYPDILKTEIHQLKNIQYGTAYSMPVNPILKKLPNPEIPHGTA